jgi:hypothetical protein
MTRIELTGQATATNTMRTRWLAFKALLEGDRLTFWNTLTRRKRIALAKSAKDPIITLAYQIYRYLDKWFDSEELRNDNT